jgi:hypothetical protein
MAERGTCQDTERNPPSRWHSLSREGRERLVSTWKKTQTSGGHSPTGDDTERDFSGHGIKITELGELTA